MSSPLEVLRTEGGVIAAAPWSFAICLFVVGGVIFLILRAMKAQEITDLNSRLTLRNDEIDDYRRKLDVKSLEEAQSRLDSLEVKATVEAEESSTANLPEKAPARVPKSPALRVALKPAPVEEKEYISAAEYAAAIAKTKNMTMLQASQARDPLVGKWMVLSGELYDVRESSRDVVAFIKLNGEMIACKFSREWRDELSKLAPGDQIQIVGQIRTFSAGARFEDCELVEKTEDVSPEGLPSAQ